MPDIVDAGTAGTQGAAGGSLPSGTDNQILENDGAGSWVGRTLSGDATIADGVISLATDSVATNELVNFGTLTGTSGNILVADGTDFESVAMSGDVTISSAGVTAIGASKITYAMLSSATQPCMLVELMDADPSGTGVRPYEFRVPSNAENGSATWTFVNFRFRLSTTSSSGNPTVNIQYSTASGAFSSSGDITASGVAIAAGNYENSIATFTTSTVSNGNKLKVNVTTLGTGAAGWSVLLLMRRTA